jgi:hypothetical protein
VPIGCYRAVGSGMEMDDLDSRLTRIGYHQVRREAPCWRISQVSEPLPRPDSRPAWRGQKPELSRTLRLWLKRLGEAAEAQPYRICRVTRE